MDNKQIAVQQQQVNVLDSQFDPKRMNQMVSFANEFYKAGCFGRDVQNPHQALVKIQAGYEMGLPPIEAMNSLYIVNGKITLWGTAQTKKLREHGWKITYDESKNDQVTVTITKGEEKYSYTATAEQLRKMKGNAFGFAPKDKLRWHAISRLIRFYVPEVMSAGMYYSKEEMEDSPSYDNASVVEVQAEETKENNDFVRLQKMFTEGKTSEAIRGELVSAFNNGLITPDQATELKKELAALIQKERQQEKNVVDVKVEPVQTDLVEAVEAQEKSDDILEDLPQADQERNLFTK